MTVFNLKDELTFGKYKGYAIEEILRSDPDYLAWCCDEIEWFELDNEADDALEHIVNDSMLDDKSVFDDGSEYYKYDPWN